MLEVGINFYLYGDAVPTLLVDPHGLAPGPYHPPGGLSLRCYTTDDCPELKKKIYLLGKMIDSHVGWDNNVRWPRGGGRHKQEIIDLWNALQRCLDIYARKRCEGPPC